MANYTTKDLKDLRERTGAGLADVKKALEDAEGNIEKALEIIRIKGLQSLSKREGRSAGAGLIAAKVTEVDGRQRGTVVAVNAETDFVVKTDKFIAMANEVLDAAAKSGAQTLEELAKAATAAGTVSDTVDALAAIIGEKLQVTKVSQLEGDQVFSYLHRSSQDLPPSIGVLVATDAKAGAVAKDIAMHIAANSPLYLNRESVPAEEADKERATLEAKTRAEGKPEAALAKIVEGRMNSYYKEVVLLDQPFVKDPSKTVSDVLKEVGGLVTGFVRLHAGAE